MTIQANQVDFRGDFRFDINPNVLRLTDISAYQAAGYPGTPESKGIYKVTGPDGAVFYKNAGWDANSFAAPNSINWPLNAGDYNPVFSVNLPKDVNGNVLQGTYTIEYKISDENGAAVTISKSFILNYTRPTAVISIVADCYSSFVQALDETNYNSVLGVYTLTLTRTFKLLYPQGLQFNPISTNTNSIIATPAYTQTWTGLLSSVVNYAFDHNFNIIDLITESGEYKVTCDIDLCNIQCGVASLNDRYLEAKRDGTAEQARLFDRLTRIIQLMSMFGNAIRCGNAEDASDYLNEIYAVGKFDKNCGCGGDSDEPRPIIPCGGLNPTNVVVTANTAYGIVVNQSVVGQNTQYDVQLAPDYKTKIDNLYNTVLDTDTPGTVTFSNSTAGYIKTTKVNVNSGVPGPGSITQSMLADDSVGTNEIQDLAVTAAKMAVSTITGTQIVNGSIPGTKISNNSLTSNLYQTHSVTANAIALACITQALMADNSIGTNELIDQSVTPQKIQSNSLSGTQMTDSYKFYQMVIPVSFDLNKMVAIKMNFPYRALVNLVQLEVVVLENMNPADDGALLIETNLGVCFPAVTIAGSKLAGNLIPIIDPSIGPVPNGAPPLVMPAACSWLKITPSKTTPGGEIIVIAHFQRG